MPYASTNIPDILSVKGIFTVHSPSLSFSMVDRGEAHEFPEIFFLDRGKHSLIVEGQNYTLSSGQMVIYAPNSHHRSASPSDAVASIISFDVESRDLCKLYNRVITLTTEQEKNFKAIFDLAAPCFIKRPPNDVERGAKLCDGVDEYTLQRIKLSLEAFLTDLLAFRQESEFHSSRNEKWNEEYALALDFLKQNIDKSLTLEDMARECKMSVSKLKLLFRWNYGGGPLSCFLELKIDEAKKLIQNGNMNFSEIASALGFNSLHYFSRAFKKITGISPSVYKNSIIE